MSSDKEIDEALKVYAKDISKTCLLILDCLELNQIQPSVGISACLTIAINELSRTMEVEQFMEQLEEMKLMFLDAKEASKKNL